MSVQNVNYDHTRKTEYRNETRQKALLAAKEKAAAMAKTLGSRIGEPLVIEEDLAPSEEQRGYAMNNNYQAATFPAQTSMNSDESEGLSLGTISITARVQISFRLLPAKK